MTTKLHWYKSDTADDQHDDIEVDLDRLDNPGGASWAAVTQVGDAWVWSIYDSWLPDDGEFPRDGGCIGGGSCPTQGQAKAAVENWVAARIPAQIEFTIEQVVTVTKTYRVAAANLDRALKIIGSDDADAVETTWDWESTRTTVKAAKII